MNDCSCSERYIARSISVILLGASALYCLEHQSPIFAFRSMLRAASFTHREHQRICSYHIHFCSCEHARNRQHAFPSMLRTAWFTDKEHARKYQFWTVNACIYKNALNIYIFFSCEHALNHQFMLSRACSEQHVLPIGSMHGNTNSGWFTHAFTKMLLTYTFLQLRACAESPIYAFPSMLRTACFTDREHARKYQYWVVNACSEQSKMV